MAVTIREAFSEEDREIAYRLRYEVAVVQLGRQSEGTDTARGWIKDETDEHSFLFLAEDDGTAVGTVRVTFARNGNLPNQEWLPLAKFSPSWSDRLSATDRLVVLPEYRGTLVPGRLAIQCFELGAANDIAFDFVLSRSHLVPLYQQMGYRILGGSVNHPHFGTIHPMVLSLTDHAHLKASRSPFQRIARSYSFSEPGKPFFESAFPETAFQLPSSCRNPEELWHEFGEQLFLQQGKPDHLLNGLSQDEVLRLLPRLTELTFEQGETIVTQGEIGLGLFCLVEGSATAIHQQDGQVRTLGTLDSGMVFGELGFVTETRRTATVIATEPCRVVILPGSEFVKLKKTAPDLALKLMSNLFATVSRRYSALQSQLYETASPDLVESS